MFYQYRLFDENGGIISDTISRKARMRGDYVSFYKKPLESIAKDITDGSTIRIYLWLCSKQTFENLVLTTRRQIALSLGLTRVTVWKSIKTLESLGYLKELNVEGNTAYLISPVVCNKGEKQRVKKLDLWAHTPDKVGDKDLRLTNEVSHVIEPEVAIQRDKKTDSLMDSELAHQMARGVQRAENRDFVIKKFGHKIIDKETGEIL